MSPSSSQRQETRRTIIVGDVHGCFEELQELLRKCQFEAEKDRLIFVGDVINKGPRSVDVLRFLRQGKHEVVVGNHELKLLEVAQYPSPLVSKSSILQTLEEMRSSFGEELSSWLEWISHWPKWIEEEDFLVVHAGLAPGQRPEDTPVDVLATIRTWDGLGENLNHPLHPAWHELYLEEKLVVYGHWATQGLSVKENSIGLDSGCVYGRELSALILPQREIVQVAAKETYVEVGN